MEVILAYVGTIATLAAAILAAIQLRRTPKSKRETEPFTPTSLTIIGAPMHRGPDLYGEDHYGSC